MFMRILIAGLWLTTLAGAAITRVQVDERSAVLGGRPFGKAGEYERVRGRAYFQVDPKHPLNRGVVDIDKAPLNPSGLVEFSADIYVLQPRDPAKGKALVDLNGMTLYVFVRDGTGKSTCNAQCSVNWPPLIADIDATASGNFSFITRDDGRKQWAYKGKPLYTWVKDKAPGDTTGDGINNVWHLAAP